MTSLSRQKLLGQFFSGKKIANTLYDLLGNPNNAKVIDPMCGKGDLLLPFTKSNDVYGIELDKNAYSLAKEVLSTNSKIKNGNAFDCQIFSDYCISGYDIVVTNPPFIRREIYQKSLDIIEGTIPHSIVIENLTELTDCCQTLNNDQKERVKNVLKKISGLSDIAILSWILCIIITKIEGLVAFVAPNTLLFREYSVPVMILFKELFEIDYIVNDVNSAWFKENAQIQTSLIIAKRTDYVSKSHNINIVDLYEESIGRNSIASFVTKRQTFRGFIKKGNSIKGLCEITKINQSSYASPTMSIQPTSKLNSIIQKGNIVFRRLEDFGVTSGQGFRSGANTFFILENDGVYCKSKIRNIRIKRDSSFLKPIIQNQRSLGNNYAIETEEETSSLLVIPRGYASTEDIISITNECLCILSPVPGDIQSYIKIAANETVGNNKIPDLSAVKTNIKDKDGIISFWYNLPPFTKRHTAQIFIPRVNGGEVVARFNPNKYIVDANFITFWIDDNTKETIFTNSTLIALLNSTWFKVLCEESGIVMGGGALKLDSIQIQKFPFPIFTIDDIQKLSEYGIILTSSSISASANTLEKIDRLILKYICEEKFIEDKFREIQSIQISYQKKRSK